MKLLETIRQVGIFIICAQTLIHFRPDESYEKYMKLLVSVMVLVQLVLPVAAVFRGDAGRTLQESIDAYEAAMREEIEDIGITSVTAEEKVESLTMEEIKSRLEKEKFEAKSREADGTRHDGGGVLPGENKEAGIEIDRIEVGGQ